MFNVDPSGVHFFHLHPRGCESLQEIDTKKWAPQCRFPPKTYRPAWYLMEAEKCETLCLRYFVVTEFYNIFRYAC